MKKNISTLVLSCLLLFSNTIANASEDQLKLRSGNVALPTLPGTTTLESIENTLINNYVIVQFNVTPSNAEKSKLEEQGLTLLEYLPVNAFISELKDASNASISSLNIVGIIPFISKYKLSKNLIESNVPEWAINGDKIDLMVEFHNNVDKNRSRAFLESNNIETLTIDPSGVYSEIRINRNQINFIANAAITKALDFIPASPEPEDQEGRTLHRGNMLDSEHPLGRKYDGTGVSIAIADDAVIGPHIDIKGRVTSFPAPANGTHGDMTTGIAMGGGNLNPDYRGMATGAYLYYYGINGYPHIAQAVSNLNTRGVVITSTSFSEGCNAGYTTTTRTVDQQTRQNPELLHVFSAGNSSSSNCGYGAGTPWGTITGGRKQGKSTIATGNLNYVGSLVNSSSRGPAEDGRIKPDICANGGSQMSTDANNTYQVGGGTSAASPGIAGLAAQMYHGYRTLNGGANPESALIKSAMLNTARDIGNPGPDFSYGWGRVNAHRAMTLIEENRYLSSTISQGGANSHNITIPANSDFSELKFMVYWADYEASTVAAQALVNNLDFKVVTPFGDTVLPWILDPSPNVASITSNATRGIDDLNNMEQVTIDSIVSGNYTLLVDGKTIPQGPQKYFVVWENRNNETEVTYPHGGESFTPGQTETIRWDSPDNTGFTIIDYSTDGGSNWNAISVTNGAARFRDWAVPNVVTGNALVRIRKGTSINNMSDTSISQYSFSIIGRPTNVRTDYRCPDSIGLTWDAVAGATEYEISVLGATHMDSVGRSTTNSFVLRNLNLADDNWVSVKALGIGIVGKRANAIELEKSIDNCPFAYDVELEQLTSPGSNFVANCGSPKIPVTVRVLNNGDSALQNIPLRLSVGSNIYNDTVLGPLASGATTSYTFNDSLSLSSVTTISLSVVSLFQGDQNLLNDRIDINADVLNSSFTLPYSNDFESFSTCATTNNCGGTTCNLNGGWLNLENGTGDDFDMRVNFGGTPSNGTGPSTDHNPGTGTGRYMYSEASNGCEAVRSRTISPCFDLSNTISPEFSFWYHMNGTDVGTLRVDVYSNGVWTNNITPQISGSQGNIWRERTIDMSSYVGQIVNFRFIVTTGNGWSSDIAIDDISFTDISTGIENISQSELFKVYPNPSEGVFTLQFDQLPKNNIQIIDMNGRIVQQVRPTDNVSQLDLSSYGKGIYFLTIENTPIREKLIVY